MKKKILCTGLAMMILASPLTVFADDTTTPARTRGPELTAAQKADMDTYRAYVDDYLAGKITLEQLKAYHDELLPDGMNKNDTNFEAIMQLQKDYKNGTITKEEFTTQMDALRPKKPDRGNDSERGNRPDGNGKNHGTRPDGNSKMNSNKTTA